MDWTHRIRLRHLKVLVSLAETRNVSRSAVLLHMTQPALSKWLKELEQDLGLTLFERHARGLRMTAYGEALLEHARRIDIELNRARDEMDSLRKGSSGYVAIGGSGAAIATTIPAAVLALLKRMPAARVDVVESTMDRLIEKLGRRELDIAVGRSQPQYLHADVQTEVLYQEPVHFVARPHHPLHKKRKNLSWDDLDGYRWVVFSSDTPVRAVLDQALHEVGRYVPSDALQSNSVLASFALLAASDMVTIASERSISQYEKMGALKRLPLRVGDARPIAMYWRRDEHCSSAVEATLQCLRDLNQRSLPRP